MSFCENIFINEELVQYRDLSFRVKIENNTVKIQTADCHSRQDYEFSTIYNIQIAISQPRRYL